MRTELNRLRVELQRENVVRLEAEQRLDFCGNEVSSAVVARSKFQELVETKDDAITNLTIQITACQQQLFANHRHLNETLKLQAGVVQLTL